MSNYQLVTCNHSSPLQDYYCEREFHASLARYNVTPIILGQPPHKWHWGGLGSKAKWLKRAIDEKIITAEIVIFTDCHDLVYADRPEVVVETFLEFKKPIIWGAEKNCFTAVSGTESFAELTRAQHPTPYSYKYLNSGWGMGYKDALQTALEEMNPEAIIDDHMLPDGRHIQDNDQHRWMRAMLLGEYGKTAIGLDSSCELVQNYHAVSLEEISFEDGGRIKNHETGTYPLIHHLNGGSKTSGLREPILKHLGL